MLRSENSKVRSHLLEGHMGLEKESLRITRDGFLAQTPDPFRGDPFIVKDFCENQTEINTAVCPGAEEVLSELCRHNERIENRLDALPEPEYLWPFSNPPYIRRESDIPIARYEGAEKPKEIYREYLAERYGRYKMTFSGIHFNYSFSEELLREAWKADGGETCESWRAYKDRFYVELAAKAQACNWVIVALTAASPLLDSSYVEKGVCGKDVFNGMASTRCSELGYWNFFTPVLDYSGIREYVDSIRAYLDQDLIRTSSELYYPVRLKPEGPYSLEHLVSDGVSHIELRMIDLNPFAPAGIDLRDVRFIRLLLVYLASVPKMEMGVRDQIFSIQNTKNAAHYDLKTVNIITPLHKTMRATEAARALLRSMKDFYGEVCTQKCAEIGEVLDFELAKVENAEMRYAWRVRELFSDGFVEKGLALCRERAGVRAAAKQDERPE